MLVRVTLAFFLYLLLPCNNLFASENTFSFNLLTSKELEVGEYKLNHPEHSPVISDENENFYIRTQRGFNKYNSAGDLVFEFVLLEDFKNLSNLVYTNGLVLFISKQKPGYLYVVNVEDSVSANLPAQSGAVKQSQSQDCLGAVLLAMTEEYCLIYSEDLIKIEIYEDTGDPPKLVFTPFGFSNIGLDNSKNYLYFASHNNPRAYKYDILNNELSYTELAEDSGYVLGTHVSAPIPLGDSAVLFSTNEGFIQKFINENIAVNIFTEKYLNEYAFLNSRSDYTVPLSASENFAYFLYDNYICKFGLSRGVNELCAPYADRVKREGNYVTNLSNYKDTNYLGFSNKYTELERTGLAKITGNLERGWDKSVYRLDKGGVFAFDQGVIATADDFFVYDTNGNLLDVFVPNKEEDTGLVTASIFSTTQKGNYYVFYSRQGVENIYSYIYKFSGETEKPKECPLPYYCTTTPKHKPVIFVHGLGGHYQQWFDGQNAKLREAVLAEYRNEDSEFPDQWAHAYSYGINFNQDYDYQGKIEHISTNMHSVVEKLAAEHKLAGGEGKVDIVAYSLGGLVARHYILEKTGFPGEQNLNVDHKVSKLILIASPVNGSSVLSYLDSMEPISRKVAYQALNDILNFTKEEEYKVDLQKDIGTQLSASSNYLSSVREHSLPGEVEYYSAKSEVSIKVSYAIFNKSLYRKIEFGDGVVLPKDTLLYGAELSDSITLKREFSVEGFLESDLTEIRIREIPSLHHLNLVIHPEVVNFVLNYLHK